MAAAADATAPVLGEIRTIQYLRGLAAFGVLAFHAAERAGYTFDIGAAGVDVFFVISGFIMWTVSASRPTTPGAFLTRRIKRIAPLYWAVTLTVSAVAVLIPGSFPRVEVTVAALLKSLFFVPYRDPQGLIAPLIIPGWTLNYEMAFYLLFALALLTGARLRPWLVTGALAGLVLLGLAVRPQSAVGIAYTDPVLLEFAAGVWLGKLWSDGRLGSARAGWTLALAGFAAFAAAGFFAAPTGLVRVAAWGAPALMLVAGAVTLERARSIPDLMPLRALGDASYSVYLVHALAISIAVRGLALVGVVEGPVLFCASLATGLIVGVAAYALVEKPAMALLRGARRPAASVAPAGAG
ncbi:MAG: acyltransferase [Phenylobacterium sp.]